MAADSAARAPPDATPGRGRVRYLARRLGQSVVVLGIVLVVQFFLLHLAPGDIADVIAGETQASDPAFIGKLRKDLGLDQPVAVQFGLFAWRTLTLDLGTSHAFSQPVTTIIVERLPASLLLMLTSIVLALFAGVALGAFAALTAGRWQDLAISVVALLFYATPAFLSGIGLILVFSVWLQWLPMTGMLTPGVEDAAWGRYLVDLLAHLAMPMVSLALFYVAIYARLMRASMLEVMNLDFVRTARAKGLRASRILWRHVARNALLPVFTMLGLQTASLLGGAVLVEVVFGWPGIGRLAVEAVFRRDVPVVMGVLLMSSVLVLVTSLVVDLLYTRLDPRIVLR